MSRGTRANSRSNVRSSNSTWVIVRAMACVSASRVRAMNSGTARRGAAPAFAGDRRRDLAGLLRGAAGAAGGGCCARRAQREPSAASGEQPSGSP